MPDPACPRCAVPLLDQPDYCWSCGFYVGDRWRTTQLEAGDVVPRVVEPADLTAGVRVVSGDAIAGPTDGIGGRWVVRIVAVAALVIVGLLAIAMFGGQGRAGSGATSVPSRTTSVAGTAAAATLNATPPALAPTGPTTEATVTRVVDGDTIVVDIGGESFRVRYIGMDTPESVKPDTPIEPLGEAAAAANQELVGGRTVILERDVSEADQFGRLLRDAWVERGGALVMVGLELVRAGLAQVTTFPPDVKYVEELLAAQAQARADGLGLWAIE